MGGGGRTEKMVAVKEADPIEFREGVEDRGERVMGGGAGDFWTNSSVRQDPIESTGLAVVKGGKEGKVDEMTKTAEKMPEQSFRGEGESR